MPYRALDLGDTALTLEFGNAIDPTLQAAVAKLDDAIAQACAAGLLPGLVETMPSFRSLTVIFDPLITDRAQLLNALHALNQQASQHTPASRIGRHWSLPICYDPVFAPDLEDLAQLAGLNRDDAASLHHRREYVVYMLGFLPGFPFMGDVAAPLRQPRRSTPRTRVPAGSVAVANSLTAVYPWESPGGWQLIGRCPVPLFDPRNNPPALLAPADRVRFSPVSATEFARLEAAISHDEVDIKAQFLHQ